MKSPQELILDLIESAQRWNSFDGPKIAFALRDNRHLWRAVVLTDGGAEPRVDEEGIIFGVTPYLTVLRGLPVGSLHYDVIRATPEPGQEKLLEDLFFALN